LKLGHSSSSVCPVEASLNEPVICYILDGVLILYSIITTVLFFKVKVSHNTGGILSTSFTWNAFPTVLKEFPHMLSTYWLDFLHSAVQLIPTISIGLRLDDCGGQVI
uniref:Uncharacterized protein n=1 Tax=Salmo trutta TaxID=8032 RepID=A0A673Y0X3_SALTR